MRLYHLRKSIFSIFVLILATCSPPQATQALIHVTVSADQLEIPLEISAGSTVENALEYAGVSLSEIDRVEPPVYTILTDKALVKVIRVVEEFVIEKELVPFEKQILQTDSLEDQARMLVQSGENGVQEITYRVLSEDGREISRNPVKAVVIQEPSPEVVMVGVRTAYSPISIPGKLAYLSGNNAWLMEQSTANRRPLITSGDMDGRIFRLSDDGNWLLFTRKSKNAGQINELWVANIANDPVKEIDLQVDNVIQFADWVPGSNSKVVFSTVEPREAAPGWQANNDLYALSFSESGWTSNWRNKPVLEPNAGGVYGWWGMNFSWSPSSDQLAYARPDQIGVLDFAEGAITPLLEITPLQTGGDWAWVPGLTWGSDGSILFAVNHDPPEVSQTFELVAIPVRGGEPMKVSPQSGMFAYPVASPLQESQNGDISYQVAFLQAIFPTQSESSRYQLVVMDRDGSNTKKLFPLDPGPGLEPQSVNWSPTPLAGSKLYSIAIIYQGNLWLIDSQAGGGQQVTGDGLTSRLSWR